jgi:hypothetical protein
MARIEIENRLLYELKGLSLEKALSWLIKLEPK